MNPCIRVTANILFFHYLNNDCQDAVTQLGLYCTVCMAVIVLDIKIRS